MATCDYLHLHFVYLNQCIHKWSKYEKYKYQYQLSVRNRYSFYFSYTLLAYAEEALMLEDSKLLPLLRLMNLLNFSANTGSGLSN